TEGRRVGSGRRPDVDVRVIHREGRLIRDSSTGQMDRAYAHDAGDRPGRAEHRDAVPLELLLKERTRDAAFAAKGEVPLTRDPTHHVSCLIQWAGDEPLWRS